MNEVENEAKLKCITLHNRKTDSLVATGDHSNLLVDPVLDCAIFPNVLTSDVGFRWKHRRPNARFGSLVDGELSHMLRHIGIDKAGMNMINYNVIFGSRRVQLSLLNPVNMDKYAINHCSIFCKNVIKSFTWKERIYQLWKWYKTDP